MFMERISNDTHCNLCDISIKHNWNPGRGRGWRHNHSCLMYVTASPTKSEYKNGICAGKTTKIIEDYNNEYNFNAYYTSLIKCVTSTILRRFELDNCRNRFIKELKEVSPKVIITIGDNATSEILSYTYFKQVVDKPHVITINDKEVIVYPIQHPSYKGDVSIREIYDKSFERIAKLYKGFIDKNYLML